VVVAHGLGIDFLLQNATNRVVMEAKIVPSGVAEVARFQAREGFVYLRP
jgi:intracellular sulfur oxidation DsrE/DsrF family protein